MRKENKKEKVYIYGKHALIEALQNMPQVVRKVFLSPDMKDAELRVLLTKNNIPTVALVSGKGKELVGKDAVHQGVIAVIDPSSLLLSFDDFIKTLNLKKSAGGGSAFGGNPAVVIFGEIQDPHNVGAIVRSVGSCIRPLSCSYSRT
jgi:tRNA G18 (ribose-2'-O)-methylase SpoU